MVASQLNSRLGFINPGLTLQCIFVCIHKMYGMYGLVLVYIYIDISMHVYIWYGNVWFRYVRVYILHGHETEKRGTELPKW